VISLVRGSSVNIRKIRPSGVETATVAACESAPRTAEEEGGESDQGLGGKKCRVELWRIGFCIRRGGILAACRESAKT